MTGVAEVDGTTSTQIRITAIPNSYDITPVRNQILEIDLINTNVTASVDAISSTGVGFSTTTTSAGTTTTTVSSVSSNPSSSAY
jgi:hypothetical protein